MANGKHRVLAKLGIDHDEPKRKRNRVLDKLGVTADTQAAPIAEGLLPSGLGPIPPDVTREQPGAAPTGDGGTDTGFLPHIAAAGALMQTGPVQRGIVQSQQIAQSATLLALERDRGRVRDGETFRFSKTGQLVREKAEPERIQTEQARVAARLASFSKELESIPYSESTRRVIENPFDLSDKEAGDYLTASVELGISSLPLAAPAMAGQVFGALFGPAGSAAGAAAGTFLVEYPARFVEELRDRGVDVTNAEVMRELFTLQRPDAAHILGQAQEAATSKALALTGTEAVTALGLASAARYVNAIKSTVRRAGGTVALGVGEAASEAAGEFAATGDPAEAFIEGLAAGPIQAPATALGVRKTITEGPIRTDGQAKQAADDAAGAGVDVAPEPGDQAQEDSVGDVPAEQPAPRTPEGTEEARPPAETRQAPVGEQEAGGVVTIQDIAKKSRFEASVEVGEKEGGFSNVVRYRFHVGNFQGRSDPAIEHRPVAFDTRDEALREGLERIQDAAQRVVDDKTGAIPKTQVAAARRLVKQVGLQLEEVNKRIGEQRAEGTVPSAERGEPAGPPARPEAREDADAEELAAEGREVADRASDLISLNEVTQEQAALIAEKMRQEGPFDGWVQPGEKLTRKELQETIEAAFLQHVIDGVDPQRDTQILERVISEVLGREVETVTSEQQQRIDEQIKAAEQEVAAARRDLAKKEAALAERNENLFGEAEDTFTERGQQTLGQMSQRLIEAERAVQAARDEVSQAELAAEESGEPVLPDDFADEYKRLEEAEQTLERIRAEESFGPRALQSGDLALEAERTRVREAERELQRIRQEAERARGALQESEQEIDFEEVREDPGSPQEAAILARFGTAPQGTSLIDTAGILFASGNILDLGAIRGGSVREGKTVRGKQVAEHATIVEELFPERVREVADQRSEQQRVLRGVLQESGAIRFGGFNAGRGNEVGLLLEMHEGLVLSAKQRRQVATAVRTADEVRLSFFDSDGNRSDKPGLLKFSPTVREVLSAIEGQDQAAAEVAPSEAETPADLASRIVQTERDAESAFDATVEGVITRMLLAGETATSAERLYLGFEKGGVLEEADAGSVSGAFKRAHVRKAERTTSLDALAEAVSEELGREVSVQEVTDAAQAIAFSGQSASQYRKGKIRSAERETLLEALGRQRLTDAEIAQLAAEQREEEAVVAAAIEEGLYPADLVDTIADSQFISDDGQIDWQAIKDKLNDPRERGGFFGFVHGLTDAQQERLEALVDEQISEGEAAPAAGREEAAGEGDAGTRRPTSEVGAPPGFSAVVTKYGPQSNKRKRPTSARDVINSFERVINIAGRTVPIRTGHMGRSQAAGFFKVFPEVIRLREANDIPVAAHEIGHALEKAVFGWPKGGPWKGANGITGAMQRELSKLGKALYGKKKPKGGYKREGFAEYVRYWVLTDQASAVAPKFHAWFEGEFLQAHPDVRSGLEEAKAEADRWYGQGEVSRAVASIRWKPPFLGRFRNLSKTDVSRTQFDEQSPWLRVVEVAESLSGRKLNIEENPYLTARSLQKTPGAIVRYMVETAMLDVAGNPVGMSLEQALAPVAGKRREFTLYLWARRALKLWTGGDFVFEGESDVRPKKPKPPRNPGLSFDDALALYRRYDSNAFKTAAGNLYTWSDQLLDYADFAFGGLAERVKGGDVGAYIPLQRVFDELNDKVTGLSGTRRRVFGVDPVKALYGSGRRIRDPIQAMLEQAERLISSTHQQTVIRQMVKLADEIEGIGHFIEEVPQDLVRHTFSIGRVIEEMKRQGFFVDARNEVEEAALAYVDEILLSNDALRLATFFTPAFAPKGQDPIVSVYDSSTQTARWFQLDEDLYQALSGMDVYWLPRVADLFFGKPARAFRMGTTALRPAFALQTNPARDLQTWVAQTQSSANPAQMAMAWMQAMKEVSQAAITDDLSSTPYFDMFMRLGAEIALPLGKDTRHTQRVAREVFARGRAGRILRNPIDHLRDFLQMPESATRTAELKLLADEAGWKPGEPLTFGQSLFMRLAAKEVTVDFSAAGSFSKKANQIVPFWNATLRGSVAFAKAFQRNPRRALIAGLSMTMFSLWRWWENKDEEWYRELPYRMRYLYFWFAGDDLDSPLVRIPRAFEWGALFTVLPEAIMDAWYTEDPEAVEAAIGHVFDTANPVDWPVIPGIIAEQLANENFFFDTPIVPKGEEDLPPEEQFSPFTSGFSRIVGDVFNVSPRRIDHVIQGLFGGVGMDVARYPDLLAALITDETKGDFVKREREPSDIPVVGEAFIQRGGKGFAGGKSIGDFYERVGHYRQRAESKRFPETPAEKEIRLMLQDASKALAALRALRNDMRQSDRRRRVVLAMRGIARSALKAEKAGVAASGVAREELWRKFGENDPERAASLRSIAKSLAEQDAILKLHGYDLEPAANATRQALEDSVAE